MTDDRDHTRDALPYLTARTLVLEEGMAWTDLRNPEAEAVIDRANWRAGAKPSVTLGPDAPERCPAPELRVVEKR